MRARALLLQEFRRYLDVSDEDVLDIILAVALHSGIKSRNDPLWILIVGPSSSGKTQLAWQPFQSMNGMIHNLDVMTPKVFVTGFKKGKDLLPQLNHKLVLAKDMSSITSMRSEYAQEIYAQFRHIYDGQLSGQWGGEKSQATYTGVQFDFLGCITPSSLEAARAFNSQLGERFIPVYLRFNRENLALLSARNATHMSFVNTRLQAAMKEFLEETTPPIEQYAAVTMPVQMMMQLSYTVSLATLMRTAVSHDYQHNITGWAWPEASGRVVNALGTLLTSLACVYSRSTVEELEFQIARRICYDLVPRERMCIVELLSRQPMAVTEISKYMRMPVPTVWRWMQDMWVLGLLGERTSKKDPVTLSEKIVSVLATTQLLQASPVTDITSLDELAVLLRTY